MAAPQTLAFEQAGKPSGAVHAERDLLRLTTAGSVDDGKSTLIGRLLYDSQGAYEDQIASLRRSTVNRSTHQFDLALLTDGLRAEREQGITIDVAYRYFTTARRKFIIADTPGHEQYTRNMATGASTSNLAIILVNARHGVMVQSRRHAFIVSMLGIQHMVVAVNKMDLVDYREDVFRDICAEFSEYACRIQVPDLHFIPISALNGDNVVEKSRRMPWFEGSSLLTYLEDVHIGSDRNLTEFRYPVQYVIRPDSEFRGYAGQVTSGVVRRGDPVMVLPSGRTSRVRSITTFDGELEYAFAPMSVTLCLDDELDIGRGDMLVHPSHAPHATRNIDARIVWMHAQGLRPGCEYILKHTTQMVRSTVQSIRYRINVNTLEKERATTLGLNDMGAIVIQTHKPVFCDPYRRNRGTGCFILIDPVTNATVGAGMITGRDPHPADANPEATIRTWSPVTRAEQEARSGHPAVTLWMQTSADVAHCLERALFEAGLHVHLIAGNEVGEALPALVRALNNAGVTTIVVHGTETQMQQVSGRPEDNFIFIEQQSTSESPEEAAVRIQDMLTQRGFTVRTVGGA